MNPHRLKIFTTIARTKSISATARALHFTQPTVSAALNQLEKELDVQLVVRGQGTRHVFLTPAGEDFLPIAYHWLEGAEKVEYFKQAQKRKVLRLAANSEAHEYLVGYMVQKLRRRFPDLDVRLIEVEGLIMKDADERIPFDLGFYYGTDFAHGYISSIELFREERYVVCPSDSDLPDRPLLPSELDPRLEVTHAVLETNENFVAWRNRAFPGYTGTTVSVEKLTAIPAYLTIPGSWALLPVSMARAKVASSEGRLIYRRLAMPPPTRNLCALISRAYPESGVVQSFLEFCSEYLDERPYLMRSPEFPRPEK